MILVTYDILNANETEQSAVDRKARLRRWLEQGVHRRVGESAYVLFTTLSPAAVFDLIRPGIRASDLIFVTGVTLDSTGAQDQETWNLVNTVNLYQAMDALGIR